MTAPDQIEMLAIAGQPLTDGPLSKESRSANDLLADWLRTRALHQAAHQDLTGPARERLSRLGRLESSLTKARSLSEQLWRDEKYQERRTLNNAISHFDRQIAGIRSAIRNDAGLLGQE